MTTLNVKSIVKKVLFLTSLKFPNSNTLITLASNSADFQVNKHFEKLIDTILETLLMLSSKPKRVK